VLDGRLETNNGILENLLKTDYPVVVYGASGYTGRLVMEHLREHGMPFVAAGRDRRRIEESLRLVPGIESARYEIAEVEHSVEALTKLLQGRRVICNTVGPFARYNMEVAEACLRTNVHYMDTTGEQFAMMQLDKHFQPRVCQGRFGVDAIHRLYVDHE
jgi:short subunit dehydrogenase-like uncharacterized protein